MEHWGARREYMWVNGIETTWEKAKGNLHHLTGVRERQEGSVAEQTV